jgi:hypothetical protein
MVWFLYVKVERRVVSQLALAHETGQLTPGCHVRQALLTLFLQP